jgi:hypothetical protein
MAERPDYDALARDINLEDITSCERNANILRKIRDGDPMRKQLFIMNEEDEDEDGPEGFFIDEGDDLGWLGYFIGRSEVLEKLHIYCYFPEGGEDGFYEGMSQNRSIKTLEIRSVGVEGWIINAGSWIILGSFFENNRNLSNVDVGCGLDHDSAQNLASALGRMHQNSLKHLSVENTEIGDEGITDIVTALRLQSQLKCLQLYSNDIGRDGCIALVNTLSRWPHSNKLEALHLDYNVVNDEGLHALVSGLMNCCSLKQLELDGNQSITTAGLRSISPLFQSESHSLEKLSLYGINFGDDGAIALAEGLRGNKSLTELSFHVETAGITAVGWSAFSRLLCDTSTINSTYLSNHTLTKIGGYRNEGTPYYILDHLTLNKWSYASICKSKILRNHPDLDMEPLFEWKMKLLPVVISWLQRARTNKYSASRKMSALYKFVRGMPDLAVIGYWEGRMIHIEAEKRRLEYEEEITRDRLGLSGQPTDEAGRNKNKRIRLN